MIFNFGDNQQVSDITSVPEQFRSLYAPVEGQEGVHKLKTDDPAIKGAVEAVLGLNTALLAARGDVKKAKEGNVDLSPLADYGTDVQSIQAKIKELEEQATNAGKGDGTPPVDVEKLKGEFAKAHAAELTKKEQMLEGLNNQLHEVLVVNALTTAVAQEKGNPDLLMPMLQSKVKAAIDDSGQMGVYVMDAAGDRRYSGVTGKEMTIQELVSEIKSDNKFAAAFQSEAPSGSGMQPNAGQKPAGKKPDTMSANEKIAQGLLNLKRR